MVESNYIGTDATGTAELGNGIGVEIDGSNNVIGGLLTGAGNVVSANGTGILLHSGTGNLVLGNFIGTNADRIALGNRGWGIIVAAYGNAVGGTLTRTTRWPTTPVVAREYT